jgi:glycosyltransferase involved in cell wall biosynthesis
VPVPAVTLRLADPTPDEHVHEWVRALGRVDAVTRNLVVLSGTHGEPPHLDDWLRAAEVRLVGPSSAAATDGVMVVARGSDLPTPSCLRLLVAAAASGSDVLTTRVLPHGELAAEPGDAPVVAQPRCVAVPATAPEQCRRAPSSTDAVAAARANGISVGRFDGAAVFDAHAAPHGPDPATAGDDQPYGHPAAVPGTALHRLLLQTGVTPPRLQPEQPRRPFLTVVTRTQGTRLQCLEEVLTCLAGQTSRDFEVVLVCHRVGPDGLAAVRRVLAEVPSWLHERVRVLEVERPGRSSPLNDALDVANGRFAAVLDDDDAVTADWVAAFARLEEGHPGVVLRSVALAQAVRPVSVDDHGTPRGPAPAETAPAHTVWPDTFKIVDHLSDNASPLMTCAFPRGAFDDLGLRFDENLDTTEDWDMLVRAASVTGVASTPAVTAVYRLWDDGEGSRHLHDRSTWEAARTVVLARLDDLSMVWPPGAAREVRDLHQSLADETAEKFRFAALNEQAAADLRVVNEAVAALRQQVADLKERNAQLRGRLR